MLGLLDLGLLGICVFIVLCILLLPIALTVLVGVAFANFFGFTGIYWWAFVILFYIIVGAIIGKLGA